MDHHLGDPLNLESAMGVDFEHSENVVSQADIELETGGHEESIPMEFDHIEEQPMLMDTGNEEIIDFMGEQFTLQSYSVDGDQMTGSEVTVEDSQNIDNSLASHSDTMIDLQFDQAPITIPAAVGDVVGNYGPRIITVGSATPEQIIVNKTGAPSNKAVRLAPRQVAIAPKPPRPTVTKVLPKFVPGKQFAIAPKPKQVSLVKKVSLTTAMQANAKGNTVIAQIGKQFVMLPSGDANKKLKLVHTGAGGKTVRLMQSVDSEQAQLIPNQSASSAKHTKIIIQGAGQGGGAGGGGGAAHQPAVITKLLPSGAQPGARFVTVQQKMPVSIVNNNRLVIESPHKGALGGVQRAVIPQIRAGTTATTKKIVISGQNLVLKSTAQPKTTQITKTVTAGQKTQLHPINVPGKGIQYIRLVTNPTAASASVIKTSPKPAQSGKTFVFTDSKGNLIQMASEKMLSGQPPPLVVTGNSNKNAAKPPQRLVRIAPLTSKPQVVMQKDTLRSGQSLLAPISVATPASEPGGGGDVTQPLLADVKQQVLEEQEQSQEDDVTQQLDRPEEILALHEMKTEILQNEVTEETVETDSLQEFHVEPREEEVVTQHDEEEQVDSKAALHALIADAVSSAGAPGGGHASMPLHAVHAVQAGAPPAPAAPAAPAAAHPPPEIQVSFERQQSPNREGDHPLIVIPSFLRNESSAPAETEQVEPRRLMSIDVEPYDVFHSMSPPPESTEADVTNELGLRPRKPCNCTKSQCLKLYCDCFANGEFCNRCNCNNCHNNLENEELRQKAIKGCLDRNPNAFRPKIGKSKNLGPDIVRRHNKGCNCKRSGCLKNYCECYEAKIACSPMCKCVGCRNVEEAGPRARRRSPGRRAPPRPPPPHPRGDKQPCSFMTSEVIEAVCQCLVAAAAEGCSEPAPDPLRDVIHEFARCLQDIIGAASPLCAAADEVSVAAATVQQCGAGDGRRASAWWRDVIHEFARCLQDIIGAASPLCAAADEVSVAAATVQQCGAGDGRRASAWWRDVIHEFARCLQDIIGAASPLCVAADEVSVAAATVQQCGAGDGRRASAWWRDVIHEFARCLQDIIGAASPLCAAADEVSVAAATVQQCGAGDGRRASAWWRDVIHEFARCLQDIIGAASPLCVAADEVSVAAATVQQCGAGDGRRASAWWRDVIHEFARCLQDIIGAASPLCAAADEA